MYKQTNMLPYIEIEICEICTNFASDVSNVELSNSAKVNTSNVIRVLRSADLFCCFLKQLNFS